MSYTSRRPRPSLAGVVDRLWHVDDEGGGGRAETICPDGRTEIVLHFADRMREQRTGGELQPRQLLVGQMADPITVVPTGRMRMIGARLEPGALRRLLPAAQDRLAGRILDLEDVWPAWTMRLRERAGDRADAGDQLDALEDALDDMVQRTTVPAAAMTMSTAAARIERAGGTIAIDRLAGGAGLGRRQFERRFREHIGLSPHLFARIVRFQRAFRAIEAESGTSIAARCGFADQAHLVREIRRFSGRTPTLLADASGLTKFFRRDA